MIIITKEIKILRTIAIEILKTLNNLNPHFMRDLFYFSPYNSHKKHDIFVHSRNTSKYGDKTLELRD